jgi:prepilin-type N-terminal cleavage/methylation domain-containing protein
MRPTNRQFSRRAFTLIELLFAVAVGVMVAGSVVYLMFQSAVEQRKGLVNTTVEEKSYVLEANLINCLRGMSVNQGVQPDYSSPVLDSGGNPVPYTYQAIFVFNPTTNGAYATGYIQYIPASGQVLYTPDITFPATQYLWMSNSMTCRLTNFQFSTSFNLDGSQNNSLVNVNYLMDDNGFSQQNPTNNPASIFRSFSVQLRNN